MDSNVINQNSLSDRFQALNEATIPNGAAKKERAHEDLFAEFSKVLDKIAEVMNQVPSEELPFSDLSVAEPATRERPVKKEPKKQMVADTERQSEPSEKNCDACTEQDHAAQSQVNADQETVAENVQQMQQQGEVSQSEDFNGEAEQTDQGAEDGEEVSTQEAVVSMAGTSQASAQIHQVGQTKEIQKENDEETMLSVGEQGNSDLTDLRQESSAIKQALGKEMQTVRQERGTETPVEATEEAVVATPQGSGQATDSNSDSLMKQFMESVRARLQTAKEGKETLIAKEASETKPETLVTTIAPGVVLPQILLQQQGGSAVHAGVKVLQANSSNTNTFAPHTRPTTDDTASDNQATKQAKALPRNLASRTLEKVQEVLKEVARSKDGKTISVRLDPPQLGQVKVDVSLREGVLFARLRANSAQVTTLLREHGHDLQYALRRMGLAVDEVRVAVHADDQGQQTFERGSTQEDLSKQRQETDFDFENALQGLEGPEGFTPTEVNEQNKSDYWVA